MKKKHHYYPHCSCPPHCGHSPHCGYRGYDADKNWRDSFWEFYLTADLFFLSLKNIFKKKKQLVTTTKKKVKVAFIGNFGASCGISTYNENLLNELKEEVDIRLFAENLKQGEMNSDPDWVVRCWNRKEHPKLDLIRNII